MVDDIKKTLWAAADKLRANVDAAEYNQAFLTSDHHALSAL